MPAQKRNSSSSDNLIRSENGGDSPRRRKRSRWHRNDDEEDERDSEPHDDDEEEEQQEEEDYDDGDGDGDGEDEDEDSDGSRSSDDPANLSEWILVELPTLRTDVKCAICLGIIKKTRTVMECMHRFCRECIDKSMRLGNNECPACRTHCASRRSLRDDPRYDSLIEILYEDIERYEEEELAFHEEEENRNKLIQESIAQIFQRQSEALVTKSRKRKDKALAKYRDSYPRRRRRSTRAASLEGSEENEDENTHEGNRDSSEDEREAEIIKPRRYKRKAKALASPSTANADFSGIENDLEASRGSKGSPKRTPEVLAWGRGGARSKSARNSRIMKLTRYLESRKENDDELGVHLMLTCFDNQSPLSSPHLYLCCPPHFSVECLKEHVAQETLLRAEDIEILLVKEHEQLSGNNTLDPQVLKENKGGVQILDENETLAGVRKNCAQEQNHMVLAYRLRERC